MAPILRTMSKTANSVVCQYSNLPSMWYVDAVGHEERCKDPSNRMIVP
jgi:hypothetical protein